MLARLSSLDLDVYGGPFEVTVRLRDKDPAIRWLVDAFMRLCVATEVVDQEIELQGICS